MQSYIFFNLKILKESNLTVTEARQIFSTKVSENEVSSDERLQKYCKNTSRKSEARAIKVHRWKIRLRKCNLEGTIAFRETKDKYSVRHNKREWQWREDVQTAVWSCEAGHEHENNAFRRDSSGSVDHRWRSLVRRSTETRRKDLAAAKD